MDSLQLGVIGRIFFLGCVVTGLSLLLTLGIGQAEVQAPQNPSSAKECALCHYRWIDTFFLKGRGSELVPYQAEKVVADAAICYSCHDGSVVDSRARVYNDRHHPINTPPPPDMEIPKIFPLDENGFMQCATCHTAHGVPSEMGMEKTIFIRTANDDSAMCRQCHKDKDGGSARGNHPIDSTKIEFSSAIRGLGAMEGNKENQIICESCHRVHGAPNKKFLIDSKGGGAQLCLDCHVEKEAMLGTVHDLRLSAPGSTNIKGETPIQSGICGACHVVHGAAKTVLWAREMPKKSSGNTSLDLCVSCHREGGLAGKKRVMDYSHPYSVAMKDKGMNPQLPFFDAAGQRVGVAEGLLSCASCHDPHKGRKISSSGEPVAGDKFLRVPNKPSPGLCRQCHPAEGRVELSDHDLLASGSQIPNSQGQTPAQSGVCGVCHLIHGAETEQLWALNLSSSEKSGGASSGADVICMACHNSHGVASGKVLGRRSHPLDVDPAKKGMQSPLPLYDSNGEKAEKGKISCLSCHNPHQWDPQQEEVDFTVGHEGDGSNSFLRLRSAPQSTLCSSCHGSQALVAMTDHDMVLLAPDSTNLLGQTPAQSGVCGACHLVHNGKYRVRLWARKLKRGKGVMDKMCKSCHNKKDIGSAKVPSVDSHPEGMLITNVGRNVAGRANYFPLFHPRSGKKVTVADISCASCHDVHRWDPKVAEVGSGKNLEGRVTSSFLRMQTYSLMCIDCHGLDALFRFKYYHNGKQRRPAGN